MENRFCLHAVLAHVGILRYTPAGIPVLDVLLQHESQQEDNGSPCRIKLEIAGKILGTQAEIWQHRQGGSVCVSGFLAPRGRNSSQTVLRIQTIQAITPK